MTKANFCLNIKEPISHPCIAIA